MSDVKLDDGKKDKNIGIGIPEWFKKFYAGTPGGRIQEAQQPGSVEYSPVGQPEPERYGISAFGGGLSGLGRGIEKGALNVGEAIYRFLASQPQADYGQGLGSRAYSTDAFPYTGPAETDRGASAGLRGRTGGTQYPVEQPTPTDALAEALAGYSDPVVDYSGYRESLTGMAGDLNAQIAALYSQLGGSAQENIDRLRDIYGSAEAGIGATYDTSAQNVRQAYESAQQQAADQMARLGIGEAAGQILPTQALSQAEALSQLETGRAGGLSAASRYGASAEQFGSELAQAAQMQGAEQQTAVLRALQRQLAESQLAESMARGQGPTAREQLAQDLDLRSRLASPTGDPAMDQAFSEFMAEQEFKAQQAQLDAAKLQSDLFQAILARTGDEAAALEEYLAVAPSVLGGAAR